MTVQEEYEKIKARIEQQVKYGLPAETPSAQPSKATEAPESGWRTTEDGIKYRTVTVSEVFDENANLGKAKLLEKIEREKTYVERFKPDSPMGRNSQRKAEYASKFLGTQLIEFEKDGNTYYQTPRGEQVSKAEFLRVMQSIGTGLSIGGDHYSRNPSAGYVLLTGEGLEGKSEKEKARQSITYASEVMHALHPASEGLESEYAEIEERNIQHMMETMPEMLSIETPDGNITNVSVGANTVLINGVEYQIDYSSPDNPIIVNAPSGTTLSHLVAVGEVGKQDYVPKYQIDALDAEAQQVLKTQGIDALNQYFIGKAQDDYKASVKTFLESVGGNYDYWNLLDFNQQKEYLEGFSEYKPVITEGGRQIGWEYDISQGETAEKATVFLQAQEAFNEGRMSEPEFRQIESDWLTYVSAQTQRASTAIKPVSPTVIQSIGGDYSAYISLPQAELTERQSVEYSQIIPRYDAENPYPEGTKESYIWELGKAQSVLSHDREIDWVKDMGGDVSEYESLRDLTEEEYNATPIIDPTWDAVNPYPQDTKVSYMFDLAVNENKQQHDALKTLEPYLAVGVWQQIKEPTEPSEFYESYGQQDIDNMVNPAFDLSKIPIDDIYNNESIRNAIDALYGQGTINNIIADYEKFADDTYNEMLPVNDPRTMQNAIESVGLSDKIVWATDAMGRSADPELAYIYASGYGDVPTSTVDVEATWGKLSDTEKVQVASQWTQRDWKQVLRDTGVANFVPVLGTVINWDEMPTWGKAISIVADIASIVPVYGAAVRGARTVGTASKLARFDAIGKSVFDEIRAQVVAPYTMVRHPITTIKQSTMGVVDLLHNLKISKIPQIVLGTSDGTLRIRIGKDLTTTQALYARMNLMEQLVLGKKPIMELYNEAGELLTTIELAESPFMKTIGRGVAHATPFGEKFEEAISKYGKIVVDVGQNLDNMGLFVANQPLTRFTKSTAYGMKGEKPMFLVWSKNSKVISKLEDTGKVYRREVELEGVFPDKTTVWEGEPAQILVTRVGANRDKVVIWLDAESALTNAQLLKLKALGIIEWFKAPFKTPINIKYTATGLKSLDDADIQVLTEELRRSGASDVANSLNGIARAVREYEGVLGELSIRDKNAGRYTGEDEFDTLLLRSEPTATEYQRVNDEITRVRQESEREIQRLTEQDRLIRESDIDRTVRVETPERIERIDTAERIERGETPERVERLEAPTTRVEVTERPDRIEEPERPTRAETTERIERPEIPERPERPEDTERRDRPEETERPYKPDDSRKTRIPLGSDGKELTKEQLAGAIGWKQGIMYKYIYPPYGQEDIINSRSPIQGIPMKEGIRSAYETIIRTRPGFIPPNITRHMGMMDIQITDADKNGQPEIKFMEREHRKGRGSVRKQSTSQVFTIGT